MLTKTQSFNNKDTKQPGMRSGLQCCKLWCLPSGEIRKTINNISVMEEPEKIQGSFINVKSLKHPLLMFTLFVNFLYVIYFLDVLMYVFINIAD